MVLVGITMDVISLSPLRVGSILWQSTRGDWTLTVVCKATYRLALEESPLHAEQEAPNDDDNHWNDDRARSLYAPSDLSPFKARADILLVGSAFAPGRRPSRSLVARLRVGDMEKAVEVIGTRAWGAAGAIVEGPGFVSMPLRYERAAGGPGTWNPVGSRADAAPDAPGNAALPNLLPVGFSLVNRGAPIPPMGFGPIAPSWPSRVELLGRHRGSFTPEGWASRPLPADLDPAYFNAAPRDQQVEELRGDELILMENLHPEHARLTTRLPGVKPRVFVEWPGAPGQELAVAGDTLWIDTDQAICTLAWRGQLRLEGRAHSGRVLVVLEERGERVAWADVERMLGPRRQAMPANSGETMPLDRAPDGRAVLPFVGRQNDATGIAVPAAPLVTPSMAPAVAPSPWAIKDVQAPPLVTSPVLDRAKDAGGAPGALAASNAAAAVVAKPDKPESPVASAPKPAPEAPARERPREMLELVWYDASALPRIRRHLAWKKIIAELKPRSSDDDFDGGLPPDKARDAKDRRDVFGVLARGEPADMAGIETAVALATAEDGSFVPPYVLTAGELSFPFDERETLKTMCAVAAPFMAADKKLKEAVDAANELVKAPGIHVSSGLAEGAIGRLREAFRQSSRSLPEGYLETQTERILLEQRSYQKRKFAAQPCIRALLIPANSTAALPAYIPESIANEIPMFPTLSARGIGEVKLQVDQYEASSLAFRVLALARVLRTRPR
jgi:hypothetical protein